MKKHMLLILICMMLMIPSIPANEITTYEKINIDTNKRNIDQGIVEDPLPVWNNNDQWIYTLDFSFSMQEEGYDISVNLYIGTLEFKVIEITEDAYRIQLEGSVGGNFHIDVESIPSISGSLKQTQLQGIAIVEKNNLGMQYIDLDIDGKLSISIIPIPLELDITMDFQPSYSPYEFPLYVGKEWIVNGSTIAVEGRLKLLGISSLFPGMPDEIEVPPMDIYITQNTAICSEKRNMTINAGLFETYNITIGDSNRVFYSPVAGNFISIVPIGEEDDYFETLFSCKLRSTTYTVPGSPSIPDPPEGPTQGTPDTEYIYSAHTTDAEGDQLYYSFDWSDGATSGWIGPLQSGETCEVSHIWTQEGSYYVKVKAKDVENHESLWSDPLVVSMPKTHFNSVRELIVQFLEHHPNLFPLFRQIIL